MSNSNKFVIIFKENYLLIFLANRLFFKQHYIKNKVFTLFFIIHLLYKFGLTNNVNYYN